MAWKAYLVFDDGDKMDLEEEFETKEQAQIAAYQTAAEYYQGGDYLDEAGEFYSESKVIQFILESDTETIEIDVS